MLVIQVGLNAVYFRWLRFVVGVEFVEFLVEVEIHYW